MLPVPALADAFLALVVSLGLVSPSRSQQSQGEHLRTRVLSDYYRLQHAVSAFVADTQALPAPSHDLSEGLDGGLSDMTLLPDGLAGAWKGPYLSPKLGRPAPDIWWGVDKPCVRNDRDADGAEDELWARLHRGKGGIDDKTAAWIDATLDDGQPDAGTVRIEKDVLLFQLAEL